MAAFRKQGTPSNQQPKSLLSRPVHPVWVGLIAGGVALLLFMTFSTNWQFTWESVFGIGFLAMIVWLYAFAVDKKMSANQARLVLIGICIVLFIIFYAVERFAK